MSKQHSNYTKARDVRSSKSLKTTAGWCLDHINMPRLAKRTKIQKWRLKRHARLLLFYSSAVWSWWHDSDNPADQTWRTCVPNTLAATNITADPCEKGPETRFQWLPDLHMFRAIITFRQSCEVARVQTVCEGSLSVHCHVGPSSFEMYQSTRDSSQALL